MLNPLDVLVADRAVSSYADIHQIQAQGADAVVRKHQGRKNEMKKGKRIGLNDKLVTWYKPKSRPKGLSKKEDDALPPSLTVREIHYYVCIPGWRTKEVTVITTLLDEKTYPLREIAKLYRLRGEVELDLRHLKTTLKMEVLRGKTPARKEISVYLLAYNLLRTVMWEAGTQKGVNPIRLSFQGARQHLEHFVSEAKNAEKRKQEKLYQTLLELVAAHPIKKRPGRWDVRVRKRRPKAYPLMTEPRSVLRGKAA